MSRGLDKYMADRSSRLDLRNLMSPTTSTDMSLPTFAAINTYIASSDFPDGGTIRFPTDVEIVADTAIVNPAGKSFHIDARGAKILMSTAHALWNPSGQIDAPVAVTSIGTTTITSSSARPSTVAILHCASVPQHSDGSPVKRGDLLKLISDDIIAEARPRWTDSTNTTLATTQERLGEFVTVHHVSGTDVVLTAPLRDVYTTGIMVANLPRCEFSWIGGAYRYADSLVGPNTNTIGVCTLMYAPIVRDLHVPQGVAGMLYMTSCFGYLVDNSMPRYLPDIPAATGQPQVLGYTVADASSEHGRYGNSVVGNVRHGWTDLAGTRPVGPAAGGVYTNSDFSGRGRSRSAKIYNIDVIGANVTSFSPHQSGDGHTFANCGSYGSAGYGWAFRGKNHRALDCSSEYDAQGAWSCITDEDGGKTSNIYVRDFRHVGNGTTYAAVYLQQNTSSIAPNVGIRPATKLATIDGGDYNGTAGFITAFNSLFEFRNMPKFTAPAAMTAQTNMIDMTNSVVEGVAEVDMRAVTTGTGFSVIQCVNPSTGQGCWADSGVDEYRIRNNSTSDSKMSAYVRGDASLATTAAAGSDVRLVFDYWPISSPTNLNETPYRYLDPTCSYQWRVRDDSLNSGYLRRTDLTLLSAIPQVNVVMDNDIFVPVDSAASGEVVMPVLPAGHHRGQRITVLFHSTATNNSGSLRIRNGSSFLARMPGLVDLLLWDNDGVVLEWKDSLWYAVSVLQRPQPWVPHPAAGTWLPAPGLVSAAAAALTPGTCTFFPIDIGPDQALDRLGIFQVGLALPATAGTSLIRLGYYADDGTKNGPAITAAGLLADLGTFDMTTGGASQQIALALTAAKGPHGRYWGAALYTEPGTATTTKPTALTVSTNVAIMGGSTAGTIYKGLSMTGLTALPTSGTPTKVSSTGSIIVVQARGA